MAQPLPSAPSPEQLAVELAAVGAVTAEVRAQLEQATRRVVGIYIAYAGAISNPIPQQYRRAFAAAMSGVFATVTADVRQSMWWALWRALQAGQNTALSYLADSVMGLRQYGAAAYAEAVAGLPQAADQYGGQVAATAVWAADVVHAAQTRMDAALLSARAAGHTILPADVTFGDMLSVLAPLQQAADSLERDTRWAVNAAFNQAVRDIADTHGVARMWVPERDACLHCLALAGAIAQPGQPFDSSATYYIGPDGRPKPLPVYPAGPLWGPPRHPNCRCHVIPVPELEGYPVMPWETAPFHPAQALAREARRSVVKGMSGSDSLPARLRATDALLAAGAGLPRSVIAKGRRAVRRGRYG